MNEANSERLEKNTCNKRNFKDGFTISQYDMLD